MEEGLSKIDVTGLLAKWPRLDPEAEAQLMDAVAATLRRIAGGYMRRERTDHTLQPTALVNEAYLRLVDQQQPHWDGRAHFYAIAARLMRQVLVDHARTRRALKRPQDRAALTASRIPDPAGGEDLDVLSLHEALEDLAELDPRQVDFVELRYFAGLTESEVAELRGVSPATIRRDVATARAWLAHRMRSR
jgi:RNA polymerase sigma factor (TIGR02999 family)